jgi:hypothetical protein
VVVELPELESRQQRCGGPLGIDSCLRTYPLHLIESNLQGHFDEQCAVVECYQTVRPWPRPAVYCRISKDRTGTGLGVECQRGDCQALADRLG